MSSKKEKVCIISASYVGLVSGTCFAEIGHRVIYVDSRNIFLPEKMTTLRFDYYSMGKR